MKKIEMPTQETKNFLEVFEMFVISQTAKGVADITIRNYRYNMKNMGNYFNTEQPFDEVTKREIEATNFLESIDTHILLKMNDSELQRLARQLDKLEQTIAAIRENL